MCKVLAGVRDDIVPQIAAVQYSTVLYGGTSLFWRIVSRHEPISVNVGASHGVGRVRCYLNVCFHTSIK
jgi:hypothetical protein